MQDTYDPDNRKRHCCTRNLAENVSQLFGGDLKQYPTIYPIPRAAESPSAPFLPPRPDASPAQDVFAVGHVPPRLSSTLARQRSRFVPLPFPIDGQLLAHARCGNPVLHNLEDRATGLGFENGTVWVCDMSTYHWSQTLKDPRSWAVVLTALKYNIRHLGVWTAGNAGLSLAKLVYYVNRRLHLSEPIRVYCYTVGSALPTNIQHVLQGFDAEVFIFQRPTRGLIFTPDDAIQQLNSRFRGRPRVRKADYWEVTDGWDGLGLYIYRLIGRQLALYLRPQCIVAPVGTGDLFFGLYLGVRDCVNKGLLSPTDCRVYGAIPVSSYDPNDRRTGDPRTLLDLYKHYKLPPIHCVGAAKGAEKPVAPKLEIAYTPLALVMYPHLLRTDLVRMIGVSVENQIAGARALLGVHGTRTVSAVEPSALVAFGALPHIADILLSETNELTARRSGARVVVVSTGRGILGSRGESNEDRGTEHKFVHDFLPPPTWA